jgi:hypothetical protein
MPDEAIDWDAIEIELLPEECRILLKYGCPFPEEEDQLKRLSKRRGVQLFVISERYLTRLSCDLWKSLDERHAKGKDRKIGERLVQRLTYAEQWGYAEIDLFM